MSNVMYGYGNSCGWDYIGIDGWGYVSGMGNANGFGYYSGGVHGAGVIHNHAYGYICGEGNCKY